MTETVKKERRNTFLQGTFKLILGICGIVALVSAALSALSPFVDPSKLVIPAFFGLSFWVFFFANLLILFILIILKSRRTLLIPITALLMSIPGFRKSFSFGESVEAEDSISIMTYNVGVFRDYKIKSRSVAEVKESLIELIKENKPDILCLQESGKWPENTAKDFAKKTGYKYYRYKNNGNSYFSVYPIKDVNFCKEENIDKFADIKKIVIDKEKEFYLVNCHFNSFGISTQEIEYINDTKNIVKDSETLGKSVITKLSNGFKLRADNTDILLKNLPDDDIPMIICGDFNDTPLSYTYNQMKLSGMKDAFLTASHGIGKTYCGPLPLLRIDYFWYNDRIDIYNYQRIKRTTSDHYPLMIEFDIKEITEEIEAGEEI